VSYVDSWAYTEVCRARLDTPRRLPNLVQIVQCLFEQAGKSFSAALGDGTRQSAYSLLSRSGRAPDDLIYGHRLASADRCRQHALARGPREHVVVVQDTVIFDYFTHRACKGLGPIDSCPDSRGVFAHSALALTREGEPLGVLGVRFWTRDPDQFGSRTRRKKRPISEKETGVWLKTVELAKEVVAEEVPLTFVQDRGGDLYALLAAPLPKDWNLVVRAYQSRRCALWPEPTPGGEPPAAPTAPNNHLKKAWREARVVEARREIEIAEQPGTPYKAAIPGRTVVAEVRSARVRLWRSQSMRPEDPGSKTMDLAVIWVREVEPPRGVKPLQWMILTTLDADTPEAVDEVLHLYELRWSIEQLHRILKSGLRVESYQFDDELTMKNALALAFISAWRVLLMTRQARTVPESPPEELFEEEELEVMEAFTGSRPPTIRAAVRAVAKIGGWPGSTRAMMPGTDVLWRGIRELASAVRAWRLAKGVFAQRRDTG
jgi:hypothetical protein